VNNPNLPVVTVQLPIFNEFYVVDRLIETTVALKYPKDKLEIQLLDDSTDETVEKSRKLINHYKALGFIRVEDLKLKSYYGCFLSRLND
ncbi:hypothetical protein LEP1GSC043_0232, partial [Leptospira weilii str. Ecochallenge]